jgi:tetratricopeptide (TPR) repeat protein
VLERLIEIQQPSGRVARFVDELYRRRVPGATMAYLAAAFVALLVAEVVAWVLDLPRWVLNAAAVLALVGLPVNVVLAWYFDVVPGDGSARALPRKPGPAAIGILVAIAVAGAAWRWWPRPEPAVGAPVRIAVADFANGTDDRGLEGLSGMLSTALEQSRRLSVLSRGRMVEILAESGAEGGGHIDEALGRRVASRAGVAALVSPSIHRFDDVYAIEMKVLDPVTGEYLFTVQERGTGKASIPGQIDRLAARIREELRESRREIERTQVGIATVTTGNVEAYEHYFQGMNLYEAADTGGALREMRRAVHVDPSFALAHYQIAFMSGGSWVLPRAERFRAIEAAQREASRLSPRDRLRVEALAAEMRGDAGRATAILDRLVQQNPGDKELLYLAGDRLHHGGDPAGARPYLEASLALDTGWSPPLYHLIEDLADLGEPDELLRVARRSVATAPSAVTQWHLAFAHAQRGEIGEAIEVLRQQGASGGWPNVADRLELDLLAGRIDDARQEAETLQDQSLPISARSTGRHEMVKVLAAAGRRSEAMRMARQAPDTPGDPRATHEHDPVSDLLARDADPGEMAREVRSAREVDPTVVQSAALIAYAGVPSLAAEFAKELEGPWRTVHDGVAAWRAGRLDDALSLLEQAAVPRQGPRLLAEFFLGELLAERGRHAEAVVQLRKFIRRADWPFWPMWRCWAQPRARLLVARSLAALGRRVEARSELDDLLQLWSSADPDLPDLLAARELRSSLEPGAGG